MEKRKFTLVGLGIIIILSISAIFILNGAKSKGEDPEIIEVSAPVVNPELQVLHDKKVKEADVITKYLQEENGFFEQVGNRLTEKDYEFQMMLAVRSIDDIQVKYILTNKKVTEAEQGEVKSIFYEIVEKNNLDPHSFTLTVSDRD
ncbi:hypothetical protein JOD29_001680 [Lysinibacillus composti]|uniref:Uncharacterized protein n=1 Tax=Lysinibacillus composti TaxID=720633 RepID=A0A3N9UEM6_9BACI|nr:hypothetical protein [Lysinibacillus composti]MBM7608435.1 hypothetical protein [Lysinibacillus composti]RQW74733.1 hypothetical protein EBB45_09005 [Lysinibacillus composti]